MPLAMKPEGTERRGMTRTPRRLIGTLIAVAALTAVIPTSASALGLANLSAAPTNLQAGNHSDFQIHMEFNSAGGGAQVKDLSIGLPPGEIGNPNATPKCTVAQLNADSCNPNTIVGSVTASAMVAPVPVPVSVPGDLYNLVPQPGEPARFGIVLRPLSIPPLPPILPPIILQSAVQLRTTDFGLTTVINDIPNTTVNSGDTTINSQDITLFGSRPWMSAPFMRNPTSCNQHTTTFFAVPHSGANGSGSASFTPTNCGALDFSPAFTAEVGGPGQTTNGVATPASTAILQDTDEAGLLNAVVKVPNDLNPNSGLLFGAHCDQASFQAGSCASSTVVGLATAASPLLETPLIGNVELVDSGGPFPNLGLDLKGQLHLLLQGTISITGGNIVAFNGLPDIPIARFQLTFTNPPGMLGTSRDLCVPPAPVFHADFTGYNGATVPVDASATVDGCGGNKLGKCKKKPKKHKKHRAAESKKKHKKKSSCAKKKKKHKKHRK